MKTNYKSLRGNNVQKAILKSLVIVISTVLISFTVSAQAFWKTLLENNTLNEIALAMVDTKSESQPIINDDNNSTSLDAFAALLEVETEESLELESWMINDDNFKVGFTIEEANEDPLELEDWMINETFFSGTSLYFEIETEEALEVEDWMLDTKNFVVENRKMEANTKEKYIIDAVLIFENVEDYELKLEPWMMDDKVWEK